MARSRAAGLAALAAALAAGAAPAADSGGPPRGAPVDLLRLVDLERDSVHGRWTFEGSVLVAPRVAFGRLRVPYAPPPEYDLRALIERRGRGNSLNLGLAFGDRQFVAILDGNGASGLDLVDARPFYENPTTVRGAAVPEGRPVEVRCSVRRNRVTVAVDGRTLIDWKADWTRVSLHPGWKMPERDTLFVGSFQSSSRFHALELLPVTGTGRRRR